MAVILPNLDEVTTIRADGSRPFVYPADTHGRFTLARRVSALLLIAFYLSLPWIRVGGFPAVFLDVANRRFHLFGITLAAQDMWLLFFVITGLGFSLFFITALLGRIWCGWACPQTVFLDHVYRRIERWIDGDAVRRRALAAAPLSAGKILRRGLKHALYLLVSAVIAHLFLAYFVSIPDLWAMMRAAPGEHWSLFVFMGVFTGALYFNFGWFREQLCIVICPYGRIQSALIDDHSLVIGYDAARGEPRGNRRTEDGRRTPEDGGQKTEIAALVTEPSSVLRVPSSVLAAPASVLSPPSSVLRPPTPATGDCIACNRCVHVCPTGIDIRQGLQMECIGCTACIDACDDVMTRLQRPRGLIRYDSQNAFAGRTTRWLRPRTLLYGVLLGIGAAVATWALSTVRPASFGVTRIPGAPYIVDAETVRNQFLVRLVNKRPEPATFVLTVAQLPEAIRLSGFEQPVVVAAMGEEVRPLILQQLRARYTVPFKFIVQLRDRDGKYQLSREVEFLGPEARLLREEEAEHHGRGQEHE